MPSVTVKEGKINVAWELRQLNDRVVKTRKSSPQEGTAVAGRSVTKQSKLEDTWGAWCTLSSLPYIS
jgi:hypothetical protein